MRIGGRCIQHFISSDRLEAKSAEAILPDLVGLLSSTDAEVRQEAGWLFRLIGKPALPCCKRTLSSPSPTVRAAAAWALDWSPFHGPADDAGFLLPLLKDADESVRQAAAATCGGLGVRLGRVEGADDAGPAGRTRKWDCGEPPCGRCASAVKEHRPGNAPHLSECLYDPDEEVRQAATEALRFAGTGLAAKASAALKNALLGCESGGAIVGGGHACRVRGCWRGAELAPILLATLARQTDAGSRGAVLQVLYRVVLGPCAGSATGGGDRPARRIGRGAYRSRGVAGTSGADGDGQSDCIPGEHPQRLGR